MVPDNEIALYQVNNSCVMEHVGPRPVHTGVDDRWINGILSHRLTRFSEPCEVFAVLGHIMQSQLTDRHRRIQVESVR